MRRTTCRLSAAALVVIVAAALVPAASAGTGFFMRHFVIGSGGGTSDGGGWTVKGTVGQASTGETAGISFSIRGGFWRSPPPPIDEPLLADLVLAGTDDTGVAGETFVRCIVFTLFDADTTDSLTIETEIEFTDGAALGVDLGDCAGFDCVAVYDPLHTLVRTAPITFGGGGSCVLDLTGPNALVGGNANGDAFIDILDFGFFIARFGTMPGADTDCMPTDLHLDFSADGVVDTADYTFIASGFFLSDDGACVGGTEAAGPAGAGPEWLVGRRHDAGPRERISVAELVSLGLDELIAGDLNRDGWLDEADVAQFVQQAGSMP
ncbi:MAG: hypothetical protein ACYTJ0_16455 [Planctomycetota bacterium]|jgi:hypothetical protein